MDLQKLSTLVAQQVAALGFELVCMETAQDGHDPVIRFYVDYLDAYSVSGNLLDIEDCITINDALIAWMDVEFPSLREDFVVEVSSPGLERPLVKFEHFRRFCGHMCRIQTTMPIDGQKRFRGRIKEVTEKTVDLEEDGEIKVVPIDMIQKARLAPFDEEKSIPHRPKIR
jgi:ribosome maturation factor RimP